MEEVTILTPTETTNRYGDTVYGWDAPNETAAIAIAYPTSSSEDNDKRTALISGLTLLFPDPCPPELTHICRVVARGETWEVDGDMGDWRSPWGWQPGHQVNLRRVAG